VRASHSKGFTLVELMVVVAIVAILAAMAAPSYRDMIDRYRLRSAADDVLSMLANARAQSVKIGLDAAVSSTTGASWCVGAKSATVPTGGALAGAASACDCATASACLVAGEQAAIPVGKHPGVSMVSGASFTFDGKLGTALSSGGAVADPGAITLRSPRGTYDVSVDVSPLGQATLCTPSGKPAMAGISAC
jgi:type IV fimbrial biogenesis protein FimT